MTTQEVALFPVDAAIVTATRVYQRTHGCSPTEAAEAMPEHFTDVVMAATDPDAWGDPIYVCTPEEAAIMAEALANVA